MSEEAQINAEALEQEPQTAHRDIPEGMQRVLKMKEKRTKFQRLSASC